MRKLYRHRLVYCGDYLEVDIFPVFKKSTGKRNGKAKPTEAMQKELNKKNSVRKFIRMVNTNYTADDYRFDVTYRSECLPKSDEEAFRNQTNFLRRVKRIYKKAKIEFKWVAVVEKSSRGRYHHHFIISGGVSLRVLAECWGMGLTQAKPLQFDENGIEGLARYITKDPIAYKRWSASRNLKKPIVVEKDGKLSAKAIEELCHNGNHLRDDYKRLLVKYFDESAEDEKSAEVINFAENVENYKKSCEKHFEGLNLSNAKHSYNPYNGGYYLELKMYNTRSLYYKRKKARLKDNQSVLTAYGGLFADGQWEDEAI